MENKTSSLKKLSLWQVTIIGIAYMTPMTVFDTFGIVSGITNGHVPLAYLLALGAMLLGLSGCAETPYYVSGINGTLDTSKDGSRISGGGLGVTISSNPYYPPPSRSLSATRGYAK